MTHDTNDSRQEPEQQATPARTDLQRRRLLRAGMTSSLLMTVASRPAWATGGVCNFSAGMSANASGGQTYEGCSISAGWWKNFKHRWPVSHSKSFHSVFAPVKYKGKVLYHGCSLGDVINLNGSNDPVQGTFGFHLIGAYLNALSFPPDRGVPGYAFTPQQVIDAFNSLVGIDTRTDDSSDDSGKGGNGGGPGRNRSASEYSSADSTFQSLASTFEFANNQFDHATSKPNG